MPDAMTSSMSALIGDRTVPKWTASQKVKSSFARRFHLRSPSQYADSTRFRVNLDFSARLLRQTDEAISSASRTIRPRAITETARWQQGEIDQRRPTSWATHLARTYSDLDTWSRISAIWMSMRSTRDLGSL